MRILICAGGTGGHIYPALTFANKLVELGHEVVFAGSNTRMEKDVIPSKGYKFIGLNIDNFNGGITGKISGLNSLISNYLKALKIVKDYDIVVGFGNYISVPIILAAKKLKIKTAIHEQNSIPGKANLLLDKYVDVVLCSMESNLKYFKNKNIYVTGNPQSSLNINDINEKYFDNFNLDKNKKTVLMFFGSLGSKTVDKFMQSYFDSFNEDFQIVYACGKNYIGNYVGFKHENIRVVERVDGFNAMSLCDLFVSRAGATTISEIAAIGVASILIPSPYVSNNHQYYNALALSQKEAAVLVEEKDLNISEFNKLLISLIADDEKLEKLKDNCKIFAKKDGMNLMIEKVIENV